MKLRDVLASSYSDVAIRYDSLSKSIPAVIINVGYTNDPPLAESYLNSEVAKIKAVDNQIEVLIIRR